MYRTKILSFAFVEKKREYCNINIYRIFKAKYPMNERRIKKKESNISRSIFTNFKVVGEGEKNIRSRVLFSSPFDSSKKKKNQQMSDPLKI